MRTAHRRAGREGGRFTSGRGGAEEGVSAPAAGRGAAQPVPPRSAEAVAEPGSMPQPPAPAARAAALLLALLLLLPAHASHRESCPGPGTPRVRAHALSPWTRTRLPLLYRAHFPSPHAHTCTDASLPLPPHVHTRAFLTPFPPCPRHRHRRAFATCTPSSPAPTPLFPPPTQTFPAAPHLAPWGAHSSHYSNAGEAAGSLPPHSPGKCSKWGR